MGEELREALAENGIEDKEIRTLLKNSLEGIFKYFNREKFMRWINHSLISDRVKTLIIEEFNSQERSEIPDTLGLYSRKQNTIKLNSFEPITIKGFKTKSGNYTSMDTVLTHELLHFISASNKHFSTFIDEGLTELLTIRTKENEACTYHKNVAFALILEHVFGDELFKNYLLGVTPEFESKLSSYISNDGKPSEEELKIFRKVLDGIHMAMYSDYEFDNSLLKKISDVFQYKFIPQLLLRATENKARSMGFYMIDEDKIPDHIKKKVNRYGKDPVHLSARGLVLFNSRTACRPERMSDCHPLMFHQTYRCHQHYLP